MQIAEDLVHHGASVSIANKYGDVPLDKCRGAMAKKLHSELDYPFYLVKNFKEVLQSMPYQCKKKLIVIQVKVFQKRYLDYNKISCDCLGSI